MDEPVLLPNDNSQDIADEPVILDPVLPSMGLVQVVGQEQEYLSATPEPLYFLFHEPVRGQLIPGVVSDYMEDQQLVVVTLISSVNPLHLIHVR